MNLLDPGLLPYTKINGSTFPAPDPTMAQSAPSPADPDYANKIVAFVQANAPDTFQGEPVNFYQTFINTVSLSDAFPNGDGDPALLPLLNLEIWGAPISQPFRDPNNSNFIYQRFQRGIMHYDKGCGCTQGLLLADYLKAIITGLNLPPDLDAQAQSSPYYKQYDNSFDNASGVAKPALIPGTVFKNAFEPGMAGWNSYHAASPEYGMSTFPVSQSTADRDLLKVAAAQFQWTKIIVPWSSVETNGKGQFSWGETDKAVQLANSHGLSIIARIDEPPTWARADNSTNGPPDNMQDFSDFVAAFTAHYGSTSPFGHVKAIEVWNEPNISREWGNKPPNPAAYVAMLKAAYVAAKTSDPSVTVISAGLTPTGVSSPTSMPDIQYLQGMYADGARGYFDVLGVNAPGYKAPPEMPFQQVAADQSLGGDATFSFRHVEQARQVMVGSGDSFRQVWLMEFGWTSDTVHPDYSWFAVSEDTKADYLVRAYQFAHQNWSPWIGTMALWNLTAPFWTLQDEQYWWSVTNPDGTNRPAYTKLQAARNAGTLP